MVTFWLWFWTILLVVAVIVFAAIAVLVTIGGAFDIVSMLRKVRTAHQRNGQADNSAH